ncbi:MAG: glucosyl-dolichyl phosphate glucuronosyltransferase [Halodesulfurarchaeum sp.]
MRVSVVLCTYSPDMFDHFQEAAESVLGQTHEDLELVVVVDGDESLFEMVEAEYGGREDVRLHLNEENVGLLESRNTGAELATGEVVAFIDDDAVAGERWIEELVESYEEQGAIAAGGKMVPEWVAGEPAFLPAEFYWLVGVTHRGFADGPGYVRNTFGSNISFRRDVFLDLGGFDTDIGGRQGDANLQGGETELCARMAAAYGEEVWYNPDAEVAHKVFDYRTDFWWLLDRAFWQGYSKRAMETIVPQSGDGETEFLRYLLTGAIPRTVRQIGTERSTAQLMRLLMLFVLISSVGAGYGYGMWAWAGNH